MSLHFTTSFNIQHIFNKHVLVGAPVLATVHVVMNAAQSLISTSIGSRWNISIMNCALDSYLASITTTTNPKQIKQQQQ